MHTEVRRMNEHLKAVHYAAKITKEEFLKLPRCLASKEGPKASWVAAKCEVEKPDFRSESRFEQGLGLLKANIIFVEGEAQTMGQECLRYFVKDEPNPFLGDVSAFLALGQRFCSMSGAAYCRQQAMRNEEGCVGSKTFHAIEESTIKVYAKHVADLLFFATKCPWSHPTPVPMNSVKSILEAIFFEPQLLIQQTYMTRYTPALQFALTPISSFNYKSHDLSM